jgi:hypothetical protein
MDEIPELAYARDALKILETSLELVRQGRSEFYRVAALQLRLLLCDTTRRHNLVVDISLARCLWPELRLYAMNPQGDFDPSLDPLPLSEWLVQRLPLAAVPGVTLRALVRRVCDQEGGAHVDLKPQAGLQGVPDVPGWVCKAGVEALRALRALERAQEGR